MNNENLKPCPFCGGEAEFVMSGGDRRVDCKKCGARSDWYDTEAEAIKKWNNRADLNYPEKQDSPNELMDFVKFCQNASEGCIVYINNRARDLIAKHKECCKYAECKDGREINFPTITKLTYADIKRMVKPLEWKLDCNFGGDSLAEFGNAFFRISFWGEAKYIVFYNAGIIKGGFACLDDAKQGVQEFLVDLVAAALGVERSGE